MTIAWNPSEGHRRRGDLSNFLDGAPSSLPEVVVCWTDNGRFKNALVRLTPRSATSISLNHELMEFSIGRERAGFGHGVRGFIASAGEAALVQYVDGEPRGVYCRYAFPHQEYDFIGRQEDGQWNNELPPGMPLDRQLDMIRALLNKAGEPLIQFTELGLPTSSVQRGASWFIEWDDYRLDRLRITGKTHAVSLSMDDLKDSIVEILDLRSGDRQRIGAGELAETSDERP